MESTSTRCYDEEIVEGMQLVRPRPLAELCAKHIQKQSLDQGLSDGDILNATAPVNKANRVFQPTPTLITTGFETPNMGAGHDRHVNFE